MSTPKKPPIRFMMIHSLRHQVSVSVHSLADDKTQANVSVAYDFSKYPEQLGGEYLMNFDIKDSKGNLVLSSDEALKKYIDTGNTVKGVTRVFPVSMNGTFTVSMRTNIRRLLQTSV